jgi:hypothetical protein
VQGLDFMAHPLYIHTKQQWAKTGWHQDHKWLLTVQNNNKGYNIKEIVEGGTHTKI